MLFAPSFLACCSMAHPAVRRELALRAQTALLTGAGFRQEQRRETRRKAPHGNCRVQDKVALTLHALL